MGLRWSAQLPLLAPVSGSANTRIARENGGRADPNRRVIVGYGGAASGGNRLRGRGGVVDGQTRIDGGVSIGDRRQVGERHISSHFSMSDAYTICIPCGHVYGRSCLEKLLRRSGEESAKCPQCGKGFVEKLIINLYAPENMLEGCWSPEEIQEFYEPIFAAVIREHPDYIVAEEPSSDSTYDEMRQLFTERVAQIEGTVNAKMTMAKANLMLMKERLKKMAEQEKMVQKGVIEFLEQNCPHLMIRVSCLFPSSPTRGMDDMELADVEIVAREGTYNHAVEVNEQGGRGNEGNYTALVSGEVTDGSYRRVVEDVDNRHFADSGNSENYNVNDSNKEANGMLPSTNMKGAAEGRECVESKQEAGPTCSICMEPWTSTGEHHICCIPCGHVYGWSCLIRWVKYQLSDNGSVKGVALSIIALFGISYSRNNNCLYHQSGSAPIASNPLTAGPHTCAMSVVAFDFAMATALVSIHLLKKI
uniref:Zinc finger RING-type eukaryotic domain-containing protein n=1 Tax=Aegilops tauschii TaxID=37682 RepID=N1QYD2_AEGTA